MAQGDQARVVIIDAIYCPGTEPPNQAHEAVCAPDLRRPTVQVTAETYTGSMRQKIATLLFSLNGLNQHCHALIVVLQTPGPAVKQGVGIQDAGIDLYDGAAKIQQVLLSVSLVRAEVAPVFAS